RLIILFLLSVSAYSQQLPQMRLVETPRLLRNEFVGSQHRDINDRVAAAIKVISDMSGLTYQSNNGVVDVEKSPGVDMVYLQPDERVLEIYKSGYEPLRVILSDYNIQLESRRIWELKVTGEKKPLNVTILSDPPDAEKIVDGEVLGTGESFRIVPGEHELRLRKEGYRGITTRITISEENTLFRGYELVQIDVTPVTITTTPEGADIYLNGVYRGKSYWSDFLFPEEYVLKIIKPGYLDIVDTVIIEENRQNNLTYDLTRNIAVLVVSTTPIDAQILINNQPYEPGRIELLPGEYTLQVMKSGFLSQEDKIVLELGETVSRSYELIKNVGSLAINVDPKDAELLVNRNSYGTNRTIELAPGSYRLEIRKEGYFPITENVQIVQGEITRRDVNLVQKTGSLQFSVIPNDASVVMFRGDNSTYDKWQGLRLLKEVPVGPYSLEASRRGYIDERKKIDIEYDKRLTIQMELMSYEGSIQQQITRRNISFITSAVLGFAAALLKYNSDELYQDFENADTEAEAVDLYNKANQQHKLSGYLAISAGITLAPSVYFQYNIFTFQRGDK
ncbi:PEGA domain-containing protein, partial [Vibrio sp.]|uniref:PEGA domain-containing protein n=1 Tax=Vibrio sp. TaxID=678 RepID=UPI003D12B280